MLEFKPISISDKDLVNEYLKYVEEPFCDFTFGNLFCWSVIENTEIAFLNNFLFIRFFDNEKYYYSFPIGNGEIKNAIFEIIETEKTNNKKFNFVCLTKNQTKILNELFNKKINIFEDRNKFDYIYSVEKLSSLKGRKYHSKKNHFNSFLKSYNFIYEEINNKNISECIEFINNWYESCEKTKALENERKVLNIALNNYFNLDFLGAIIRVENKIIAICVGEKIINKNMFCTHFEKADNLFPKAYTAINKLFSEKTINNFKIINREDDAGEEGLRKAKLSYQPEMLLEKYYVEFNF